MAKTKRGGKKVDTGRDMKAVLRQLRDKVILDNETSHRWLIAKTSSSVPNEYFMLLFHLVDDLQKQTDELRGEIFKQEPEASAVFVAPKRKPGRPRKGAVGAGNA